MNTENLIHLMFQYKAKREFAVMPITMSTYLRFEDERKPNKIAFTLSTLKPIYVSLEQQWVKALHVHKTGLTLQVLIVPPDIFRGFL